MIPIALLVGGLWMLLQFGGAVGLLAVSLLLAYVINPAVAVLESVRWPRRAAVATVFLGLLGALAGVGLYVIPLIGQEMLRIREEIESGPMLAQIEALLQSVPRLLPGSLAGQHTLESLLERGAGHLAGWLPSLANQLLSAGVSLLVVPFVVFFLLKDGPQIRRGLVALLPNRQFEFGLSVLHKIDLQMGAYLRGMLLDSLTVGVILSGALWLVGMPYPLLIGLLTGVANMVPYVGFASGTLLGLLVAVGNGFGGQHVLLILGTFLAVQLLDAVLIEPLTVSAGAGLHPLVVVLAIVAGGETFGFLGVLLAVPGAGVIQVITVETYRVWRQYQRAPLAGSVSGD